MVESVLIWVFFVLLYGKNTQGFVHALKMFTSYGVNNCLFGSVQYCYFYSLHCIASLTTSKARNQVNVSIYVYAAACLCTGNGSNHNATLCTFYFLSLCNVDSKGMIEHCFYKCEHYYCAVVQWLETSIQEM